MSDMQSRLEVIEERAKRLQGKHTGDRVPGYDENDFASLAYMVAYLAAILKKHLKDGER